MFQPVAFVLFSFPPFFLGANQTWRLGATWTYVVEESPLITDGSKLSELTREFEPKIGRVVYDVCSLPLCRCCTQHPTHDCVATVHVQLVELQAAVHLVDRQRAGSGSVRCVSRSNYARVTTRCVVLYAVE